MRKLSRLGAVALFTLVLAGLLVACGEPTATVAPAKTADAAMSKTTEAAMAKTTEAAMTKGTEAAMAKTTEAAMTRTTEAAMVKSSAPFSGDFNNQGAEPVAGKVVLGKTPDGKLVLRFENLKSANGPDLYVYLTKVGSPSSDAQIKAGLEVGKLKATQGNLNYALDSSLDLSQYKSVAIYCKSFSVVFGYADLKTPVS